MYEDWSLVRISSQDRGRVGDAAAGKKFAMRIKLKADLVNEWVPPDSTRGGFNSLNLRKALSESREMESNGSVENGCVFVQT